MAKLGPGEVARGRQAEPPAEPFASEAELAAFVNAHLDLLEPGLRSYDRDGESGVEYWCGGRRADLLAIDRRGGLVVVEYKLRIAEARVLGDLLAYIAWIRRNLSSNGHRVRGMIVCERAHPALLLAAEDAGVVSVFEWTRDKRIVCVLGQRDRI